MRVFYNLGIYIGKVLDVCVSCRMPVRQYAPLQWGEHIIPTSAKNKRNSSTLGSFKAGKTKFKITFIVHEIYWQSGHWPM